MKKNYINRKWRIVLFILTICLLYQLPCNSVIAGDYKDHSEDWNNTIGLNSQKNNKKIIECWKTFQQAIDDGHGFPKIKNLKDNFEIKISEHSGFEKFKVSCKCCSWHRIYFHWGFDAQPEDIKKTFIKYIKEWDIIPDEEKNVFLKEVADENKKRNREMINVIKRTFGLPSKVSRNLAAIIYDVHILGDWQTDCTDGLAKPQDIYKELERKIGNVISKSDNKTRKNVLTNLKKARNGHYKHGGHTENCYGDPCIAEQMLNVLNKDFSEAFKNSYAETLAKFDEKNNYPKMLQSVINTSVNLFK